MRTAAGLISLIALSVAALPALAQKMYKCTDSAGATTFQQSPCTPDSKKLAEEAEARAREQERLKAEKERKEAEDKRKKEENAAKIQARDAAYQERMNQVAEERRRAEEAERRILQGTSKDAAADGTLPAAVEKIYPAPWRSDAHAEIAGAFGQSKTPGCDRFRYRPRAAAASEFVVQCTRDGGTNWISYFVWPKSGAVKGPVKF